jgi:hypothetical protein
LGLRSGIIVITTEQLERDIYEFRLHFDQIYLGCIPRLLDEEEVLPHFESKENLNISNFILKIVNQ